MSADSDQLAAITFRQGEAESLRVPKLETLRRVALEGGGAGTASNLSRASLDFLTQ